MPMNEITPNTTELLHRLSFSLSHHHQQNHVRRSRPLLDKDLSISVSRLSLLIYFSSS